jgi:hypothetical protein
VAFTNLEVVPLRGSSGVELASGDYVWALYEGRLASNGTLFDGNYNFSSWTFAVDASTGTPRTYLRFRLGAGSLIKGWEQGLVGVNLGKVVELRVPAALGYGANGAPPTIPANADLIFKVLPVARIASGKALIEENIEQYSYADVGVTPPVITSFSSDSGVVGDGITSDTTPTLQITATPASTVLVWVNGFQMGAATETSAGLYTFTTAALDQGDTTIDVEVILQDIGRIRPLLDPSSAPLRLTIDSVAPLPGALSIQERTGTNDNTFLLTVSGQETGSSLAFERSLDGGTTWASTTAQQNGVADGTYQYRAHVSDVAGNSATTAVVQAVVQAGFVPGPSTIQGVTLGSTPFGYALKSGASPEIQIRLAGQYISATNPGGGWQATAAAPLGAGFQLFWRNLVSGQMARWTLEATGDYRSGSLLSSADLLLAESALNVDLDGNGSTGIQFTPGGKPIGGVTLGLTQLGYALNVGSGAAKQVRFSGEYASPGKPGGGWEAIAAAAQGSGYAVYWKNTFSNLYARWSLDSTGSLSGSSVLNTADLLSSEDGLDVDLDDDGSKGVTFKPGDKPIGGVTLGLTQLGYALNVGSGAAKQVRFSGEYASPGKPGGGWEAIAAAAAGPGYALYWKNRVSNQYARWNLDGTGSLTSGILLSNLELQIQEATLRADLNGDGKKGPFQAQAGTSANDILTGKPLTVTYGFAGDDQITSSGPLSGFDIQVGGTGSDHYQLTSGTGAFVMEQGNDAADRITAGGLQLSGGRTQWLTVEGKHLLSVDTITNSSLLLLNWEQAANRIESFALADGTYSYQELRSALLAANPAPQAVTWSQLASTSLKLTADQVGFGVAGTADSLISSFATVSAAGVI